MYGLGFEEDIGAAAATSIMKSVLVLYLMSELVFLLNYYLFLIPHANQRPTPKICRKFGKDRLSIFLRIARRTTRKSAKRGLPYTSSLTSFLSGYFATGNDDFASATSEYDDDATSATPLVNNSAESRNTSASSSSAKRRFDQRLSSSSVMEPTNALTALSKSSVDSFLAWGFFGKDAHELEQWERAEMNKMYESMINEFDTKFQHRRGETRENATPYRQSMDNMNTLYRPLLFYLIFKLLRLIAGFILRIIGFKFYRTSTTLGYWYRPAHNDRCRRNVVGNRNTILPPLLFYHGIAPGGLFIYVPFIVGSLIRGGGRTVFLFENPSVTCTSTFRLPRRVLTEDDTVQGTIEALRARLGDANHDTTTTTKVCLCGHSIGSCQLTWLLQHDGGAFARERVCQVVLVDPITILLSDSTVMARFLYERRWFDTLRHGAVHLLASTEIFTQYYVRRHLTWYNCELWLEDDVPDDRDVRVHVFLSGKDMIADADAVREEIEERNDRVLLREGRGRRPLIETVYWDNDNHGDCLIYFKRWEEIRKVMNQPWL